MFTLNSCAKNKVAVDLDNEDYIIEKVSNAKTKPGRNRLELSWRKPSNTKGKKLTKYQVYWNNERNSLEVPAPTVGDSIGVLIKGLEEGNYVFSIYAYDEKGNRSPSTSVQGQTYDLKYESALLNRQIETAFYDRGKGAVEIKWGATGDEAIGSEIKYTDNSEKQQVVITNKNDTELILDDFKEGTPILYRTLYLPKIDAIDTFSTAFEAMNVYIPPLEDDNPPNPLWVANPLNGASSTFGLIGTGNVEAPSSILIANDAVHGAVWQFLKPQGSNRCENHGIKIDGIKYTFEKDQTYYFGWYSKLTNNSDNNANFQWKSYGDHQQNFPIVLKMRGGKMILQQRQPDGVESIIWSQTWNANTWYKIAIGIHVSDELRGGWTELWFNGIKQTFSTGDQRYYCRTFDGGHNCPKWGAYGRSDLALSNYISDLKIGHAYSDVK